jgi:catechol 2,3-dioxygenase-like lactoylglutathione lyase family enzyme
VLELGRTAWAASTLPGGDEFHGRRASDQAVTVEGVPVMDMKLEAIVLPVTDVDRAKAFYETAGFHADVDHQPNEDLRVVQLTPPGSGCSIIFGKGISGGVAGSVQGLHLVVADLDAARSELVGRGVDVGEPFHFGASGPVPGLHPERESYGSFAAVTDPDGNGWLLQEVRRD